MIYETKSGARYWVIDFKHTDPAKCAARIQRRTKVYADLGLYDIRPCQRALRKQFPDRASAETALKAYAEKHRWKVVEG